MHCCPPHSHATRLVVEVGSDSAMVQKQGHCPTDPGLPEKRPKPEGIVSTVKGHRAEAVIKADSLCSF